MCDFMFLNLPGKGKCDQINITININGFEVVYHLLESHHVYGTVPELPKNHYNQAVSYTILRQF